MKVIRKYGYGVRNDNGDGNSRKQGPKQEPKQKQEEDKKKDTVKTYSVYKYSKDIPLAEEIMLGYKSTFLQIINDEPVTKQCTGL